MVFGFQCERGVKVIMSLIDHSAQCVQPASHVQCIYTENNKDCMGIPYTRHTCITRPGGVKPEKRGGRGTADYFPDLFFLKQKHVMEEYLDETRGRGTRGGGCPFEFDD